MDVVIPQFSIALPEIFLLCASCVILMVDVFAGGRVQDLVYYLVQLSLIIVFTLTLPQFQNYPEPVLTFAGNYVVDELAVISKLVIFVFSFFSFAYAREYLRHRDIARSEYYLLGLFSVLGMSIMASAYTFLTIYLGLELLSLALYAMVAMNRHSGFAVEAAMKYFVLGSFASGILLYGISLVYGLTGSLQMDTIAQVMISKQDVVMTAAMIFVLAGIVFKFGAVPFHMWVPDVYQGAAAPTTLFVASAPKVAAFAITVRVLVQAMPSLQVDWSHILIVISILSMFLGNALAIVQSNIKRMLAYSSIAHIGYTLLGVIAGPESSAGYSAAMFYITTYVLVVAGAFGIIAILSRDGVEYDKLDDFRGLNARNPWLAFMMLLIMFSMAGVPPAVGFIAKLGLLQALVQANLVWLAVLALIFALIGAYYYLRVVMLMYFDEPPEAVMSSNVTLSPEMLVAVSINGGAALLLGLLPSTLIDLCRISIG